MGQLLSAAVLVSFVAGALAFNVVENQPDFTSETISIGIVTHDFDASLAFYTDVIGMQKTGGFSVNKDFSDNSGLSNGDPFEVAVLKLADSPDATEWKIVGFDKSPKTKPSKHIQDRIGIQYVTIFVESVDPYIQKFNSMNIELLNQPGLTIPDGRRFLLIQDPNGIFVELIGR